MMGKVVYDCGKGKEVKMQFFALVPIGHAYRECLVSIGLDDGEPFVSKIEYKGRYKKWRDISIFVAGHVKKDLVNHAENEVVSEYNNRFLEDLGEERAIFSS